ncbi:hypothetical protein MPDQ_005340 [Monascus purpureus]|uniref:Uncharacterized protein n=1 Tax=Monascus purpureus TaxID=5098 RepID=A0A507QIS9_MONPU|nr:hypothetical protein MPDQ_005340 [Monascus purpureus]
MLLADNTAPMGITDAQSQQISNHPEKEAKKKNRQRHFRRTDTAIFNERYEKTPDAQGDHIQGRLPHHYQIPERAELTHLLCYLEPAKTEDEAHSRRLGYIRLMVRWQD